MDWSREIRDSAKHAGHILDADVVDELATHAQAALDAACARGLSFAEAEAHVRSLIGAWVLQAAALKRPMDQSRLIDPPAMTAGLFRGFTSDLRYAMRLLVRQRAFGVVATLTMALSIGVMTTLFSVVYAVLVRPLPWPEPDRLVRLAETHVGATRDMPWTMTDTAFRPWTEKASTIESSGAWLRNTVTFGGPAGSERVSIATVTASLFPMLRAKPFIGQIFTSDDRSEIVLSYGFWRDRFGSNPDAVGRTVQINGAPFVVVGVMPSEFMFPDRDTRLWRPYPIPPGVLPNGSRSVTAFSAMARLRPHATAAQAGAEATAAARTAPDMGMVALAMFGSNGAAQITATPVLDALTIDVKPGLIALFIAVSLLLLTAVANIASLQLARATTRYREMAIRSAIGARTSRLVQQLVIENVVLAAAGGVLGLGVAAILHRVLPSVLPSDFPRLNDIGLGWSVALFAMIVSMLAGVALGVVPVWHLRRLRVVDGLTDNSTGVIGSRRGRARSLIMAGQVAIACALLVGGGLLMRSFDAMTSQDRGFSPANVLTARLGLPDYAFKPDARLQTLEQFLDRARALPGRPAVELTTGLPLSGSETLTGFTMPSLRPPVGSEATIQAVRSVVTPGYFDAIGIRLAQGRLFQLQDDSSTARKVVVVNRTFARQYLTPAAVGDRISGFMRDDGIGFEVIGIVEDTLKRGLTEAAQPEIYSLLRQSVGPQANHEVVFRVAGDPTVLIAPVRALVAQLSPDATLESVRTMEARIASSLARPRLFAVVLASFALSALAIAAVGLFGVLSFVVAQRTREIALRAALGARPSQIFALVFRHGMIVTLGGLAAGMLIAFESVRYLSTLLYGISSHDAATFLIAPAAIVAIALVASAVPAVRALRVDPLTALRG